jgi:hypothetical protein
VAVARAKARKGLVLATESYAIPAAYAMAANLKIARRA